MDLSEFEIKTENFELFSKFFKGVTISEVGKYSIDYMEYLQNETNNFKNFEKRKFLRYGLLLKYGQIFNVIAGKKDRRTHKYSQCFKNSGGMITKGYDYVEGLVFIPDMGIANEHAWNINNEGIAVDFTYDNPEGNEYLGVIIKPEIAYKYGLKYGNVLPYIENVDDLIIE